MAGTSRVVLTLAVLAALTSLTTGCFRVRADVQIKVDGSTMSTLEVAVSEALASLGQEGDDPLKEMRENLPEGDWRVEDIEEEGWRGVRLKGTAPAGSAFLPAADGAAPDVSIKVVQRLFSTEYTVQGEIPLGGPALAEETDEAHRPSDTRVAQLEAEGAASESIGGEQFDPQELMGLMGAMSMQPSLSLAVRAPGNIVETNGQRTVSGGAEWVVDMNSMVSEQSTASISIYLRSQLPNQQSIGRLADRLAAERGMPDMAALIADYVARGLLPNPPRQDPLKAGIDVEAYESAISSIVALENVLGGAVAQRVVQGLRLNADDVTALQLKSTWDLLSGIEQEELVEVSGQAALRHIKMLGR